MNEMRRPVSILCLIAGMACLSRADEIQGVISDWSCTQDMVRNGREKTLKHRHDCSLVKNYNRAAYGLTTADKKFYRLDDTGNNQTRQLLKDTPDKDNLKVVVTGNIEGDVIKVTIMSLL